LRRGHAWKGRSAARCLAGGRTGLRGAGVFLGVGRCVGGTGVGGLSKNAGEGGVTGADALRVGLERLVGNKQKTRVLNSGRHGVQGEVAAHRGPPVERRRKRGKSVRVEKSKRTCFEGSGTHQRNKGKAR